MAILTEITHDYTPPMNAFFRHISTSIGIVFLLSSSWLLYDQSLSFSGPLEHESQPRTSSARHPHPHLETFNAPPQQVSIAELLIQRKAYHTHLVSVRGQITQPELHLDTTELHVDFVFRLVQEPLSIVVYGRHNRTLGAPPIVIDHSVEVTGIFWKEQDRNGVTVINVLEATSVVPYPSTVPGST